MVLIEIILGVTTLITCYNNIKIRYKHDNKIKKLDEKLSLLENKYKNFDDYMLLIDSIPSINNQINLIEIQKEENNLQREKNRLQEEYINLIDKYNNLQYQMLLDDDKIDYITEQMKNIKISINNNTNKQQKIDDDKKKCENKMIEKCFGIIEKDFQSNIILYDMISHK